MQRLFRFLELGLVLKLVLCLGLVLKLVLCLGLVFLVRERISIRDSAMKIV